MAIQFNGLVKIIPNNGGGTPSPTPTLSPATSTPTPQPTSTPTNTPLPATPTPTSVPTDTPTPLPATSTPTIVPTDTPTPLPATSTPTPTLSETSTPTPQPTAFVCNDCRNWEYNTVPVEGDVIHYFSCADGTPQTLSLNFGDTGSFCSCNSIGNPYSLNGTQLTEIGICINPTDTPTPTPTETSPPPTTTPTPTPTSALYPVVLYYGSVDCETTCGIYGGPSNFDTFYIDSEDFGTATKIYADAVFTPTFPYFFTNGSICGSSDGAGNLTPPSPCPSASTSTPTPTPQPTNLPTSTPTETPIPVTETPTPEPTLTPTNTPTPEPTGTTTPTPTPTLVFYTFDSVNLLHETAYEACNDTFTTTAYSNVEFLSNVVTGSTIFYQDNNLTNPIFSISGITWIKMRDISSYVYAVSVDNNGIVTDLINCDLVFAPTDTPTPTPTVTNTVTPLPITDTPTPTPTVTNTVTPLPITDTPTPTPTNTAEPTATPTTTPEPATATPTPVPFTACMSDYTSGSACTCDELSYSSWTFYGNGTNLCNSSTISSTGILSEITNNGIFYVSDGTNVREYTKVGSSNTATANGDCFSCPTPTPTPEPTSTPTNTPTPLPATSTPTPTSTNTSTPLPATSTPTPTPTNTLTPTATPFQSTFSVNVSTTSLLDACQGGDLGLQTITVQGSTICDATSIVTVPSVVLSEITFNGDMYVHQKIGPTFYSRHFRRDGNGTTFSPIDVCVDCNILIPTPTPTAAPTSTPTNTPTPLPATATPTPTNTLTPTVTPVPATATPTPTNTLTPTVTPLPATSTPTPTPLPATSTPTPEPTSTPTPTPQPVINVNYHGTTPPSGLYACNGGSQITVSMNNSDFCAATTYTSNFFTSLGTTTYYISYNGNYVQIFHSGSSNQATRSGSCQTCNNTPATAEPTAVPTNTPTPLPATPTPEPATNTPLPATSTPTPEPATNTPLPATSTPTPEPATSTPTPEGPSYDYYTADVYDCNDCSASTETITVAFDAGSSVTLNRFYIAEAGADGFSYRVTSSTVPSSPAYVLSTIWTSQSTCSAACEL